MSLRHPALRVKQLVVQLFILTIILTAPRLEAQPLVLVDLEPEFGCGTDVTDFNNGLGDWDVVDHQGGGETWTRSGDCELPGANQTGGTGDMACASPGHNGTIQRAAAFDTSLYSPEFNLSGVTGSTLHFKLYMRTYRATERLDLQISYDGGTTWQPTPIARWAVASDTNVTHPITTSTIYSAEEAIDMTPYAGSEKTALRFRYYDTGTSDWGYYVQIDDLSIDCEGGADVEIQTSIAPDPVIEAQDASINFTITNNGPQPAENVRFLPLFDHSDVIVEDREFILPEGLDESIFGPAGIPLINPGQTLNISIALKYFLNRGYVLNAVAPELETTLKLRNTSPAPAASILGVPLTTLLIEDGVSDSNDGCEPFTNAAEMSGKIALSVLSLRCSMSSVATNAAAAGAVALIVLDDSPILVELAEITDEIPILTLAPDVDFSDLIAAAATGVSATLSKQIISEYDLGYISAALSKSVDPDFSNNIEQGSFTILGDSDLDGSADNHESCDFDPAKTEPLYCGCGNQDVDSDATGVVDCLTTDEFAALIDSLAENVKKVKRVKTTGKKKVDRKRRKRMKAIKKAVKELLVEIEAFTTASAAELSTSSADVDIAALQKNVDRKAKKALRTKSKKFGKNKRRARKLIEKFRSSLMTVSI